MNISNTNLNIDFSESYKDKNTQKIAQIKDEHTQKDRNISNMELNSFVNDLNSNPILSRKLKFGFNEVSDIFYITVIDVQTNKVMKEYSKDEALNLAKKLDELSGILFDQNA